VVVEPELSLAILRITAHRVTGRQRRHPLPP
jgi:hypothetical protein